MRLQLFSQLGIFQRKTSEFEFAPFLCVSLLMVDRVCQDLQKVNIPDRAALGFSLAQEQISVEGKGQFTLGTGFLLDKVQAGFL